MDRNLTPGRIGQANEPTSPSPPRPADHRRRSASSQVGGETGCSSIVGLAVGSRRTADVRGGAVPHQRTSIHVHAYVVRIRAELAPQQNRVRTRFCASRGMVAVCKPDRRHRRPIGLGFRCGWSSSAASPGGYACQLTTAALTLPLMESNPRDSSVQPKIHRLRVPHHRWPTPSGVPRRRLSPLHPQPDERKPEFKLERSR